MRFLLVARLGETDRRVLRAFDHRGAGDDFRRGGRRALAFVAFAFGGECRSRGGRQEDAEKEQGDGDAEPGASARSPLPPDLTSPPHALAFYDIRWIFQK